MSKRKNRANTLINLNVFSNSLKWLLFLTAIFVSACSKPSLNRDWQHLAERIHTHMRSQLSAPFKLSNNELTLFKQPYRSHAFVQYFQQLEPLTASGKGNLVNLRAFDFKLSKQPREFIVFLARIGHRESAFLMQHIEPNRKAYWLNRAYELRYEPAAIELAQQSIQTANWDLVKHILDHFPVSGNQQAWQLIRLQYGIEKGLPVEYWLDDVEALSSGFDSIYDGIDIALYVKQQLRTRERELVRMIESKEAQCRYPVVILATNPRQLYRLKRKFEQATQSLFFEQFGICLHSQHWFNRSFEQSDQVSLLNSVHVGAIPNIEVLPKRVNLAVDFKKSPNQHSISLTYLTEDSELKRAYLKGRQLVLGHNSNMRVLRHELGHIVGFEDEYALSPRLQQDVCDIDVLLPSKVLGKNVIVVRKDQTFSSQAQGIRWLEDHIPWFKFIKQPDQFIVPTSSEKNGNEYKRNRAFKLNIHPSKSASLDVMSSTTSDSSLMDETEVKNGYGLFVADTCHAHVEVVAVKPFSKLSFMFNHHFDVDVRYLNL